MNGRRVTLTPSSGDAEQLARDLRRAIDQFRKRHPKVSARTIVLALRQVHEAASVEILKEGQHER